LDENQRMYNEIAKLNLDDLDKNRKDKLNEFIKQIKEQTKKKSEENEYFKIYFDNLVKELNLEKYLVFDEELSLKKEKTIKSNKTTKTNKKRVEIDEEIKIKSNEVKNYTQEINSPRKKVQKILIEDDEFQHFEVEKSNHKHYNEKELLKD